MANNTTPSHTFSQNVNNPTDTLITIDTSSAWPGNGKNGFSLDQTDSNQGINTAVSEDGAVLKLNTDGSISYDPTASSLLSTLPLGQMQTDHFKYTVVVGNKSIETVNVSVAVTGAYVPPYTPTEHTYSPTLQSQESNTIGGRPGMQIDQSTSGALEFDVSNVSSTIGSHPITSATLGTDELGFGPYNPAVQSAFDINVYAFNGTGNLAADLAQIGTLVGTGQVSAGGQFDATLNISALDQVVSHGSDLGFALVAVNANGIQVGLGTGVSGVQGDNGFQLHLTA